MKKLQITIIVAVALIIGTMVGSFSINYAMTNNLFYQKNYDINEEGQLYSVHNNEIITEENFDSSLVYKVNENGQTYGSSLYAVSFETEPDLILAEGIDGTTGYVYAADLYGKAPKNPQEAIAMQKANTDQERFIPLYASDGKTVIGEFRMSSVIEEDITITTVEDVNLNDTP
ncbi:hypothetical protein [Clostridium formicaceticum]|uniref:Uncharacterized protein n=1 Tax=Clostridium formicaceticum TaxID=1497 RepID=A0AAC9RJ98_9CLOT|nr:hypothetical protein [Clostridium formicaceticum]AOY76165.1 hypothetical protein BJL90_09775 [Clostridium formicaceticum]ARE86537.1 hypothetical protein CLFO_08590 [Clostridium formicaceticum]